MWINDTYAYSSALVLYTYHNQPLTGFDIRSDAGEGNSVTSTERQRHTALIRFLWSITISFSLLFCYRAWAWLTVYVKWSHMHVYYMELTTLRMHYGCCTTRYILIDSLKRLTWHDPLADQFLTCSSLLEFELEDCIETEEVRGRQRRKESQWWPVRATTLQRWSSELLKLPYCLLSSTEPKSICIVWMRSHTGGTEMHLDWHEEDLLFLAQFNRPFPPSR